MEIRIEDLKKMNESAKIALTKHAKNRLLERGIAVADIINVIDTGEIIKQYEDDKPLSSCLILGYSLNNEFIHIVVSKDDDYIYLITAYFPDIEKWEPGFRTRKEN